MLPQPQRVAFSQLPSTRTVQPSLSTGGFNTNRGAAAPKVLIIQNDLLCNPCTAIASLIEHDIQYHVIYAFHEHALKRLHPLHYEAIIVLGGRAAVYEESGYLLKEMEFMEKALELGVPILGICLGCQLLAKCVGGKVVPGQKGVEIGYKQWTFPRIQRPQTIAADHDPDHEYHDSAESKGSALSIPDHYALPKKGSVDDDALNGHGGDPFLGDLKLSEIGRSKSAASVEVRRAQKGVAMATVFEMKMEEEMAEINEMAEFEEDEIEFFEDESDDDDDADLAAMAMAASSATVPAVSMQQKGKDTLFRISRRPQDDSSEDEDDAKTESPMESDGDVDAESEGDPFERVIYGEGMDRFVILFHGDTFSLPQQCSVSKQDIRLLATTNHYNQLFRVGRFTYGFQGHPELTYDMLSVWWYAG